MGRIGTIPAWHGPGGLNDRFVQLNVLIDNALPCAAGDHVRPMTPRERWLLLLDGKTPDRVPTDYQSTKEITSRLQTDLCCGNIEALYLKLGIDGRRFVEPEYIGPADESRDGRDWWSIGYSIVDYGAGTYREATHHPLANMQSAREVHDFPWPSADDFDFSTVGRHLDADDGYRMVSGGRYEPFLLYGVMRGLEQAFEDLLCNPEIADAILGHIFDFHYEFNRRLFEAGKGRIDVTYIAEDLGGQTGPLMSLELYRRFLLPNQIKMADLARKYGIHIMYHTDGAARLFLPDLIDRVGIEILNPIQWRCPGMEREGLARDFGRRVIFHGAIDNQQTLSFGTPLDVEQEVRETRRIFESCRWICGPCHNFQPVTPTANVVALYQTIQQIG